MAYSSRGRIDDITFDDLLNEISHLSIAIKATSFRPTHLSADFSQIFVEPGDHTPYNVMMILRSGNEVTFAGIDYELCFYPRVFKACQNSYDCGGGHSVSLSPTRMRVGVLTFLMKVIGELRA